MFTLRRMWLRCESVRLQNGCACGCYTNIRSIQSRMRAPLQFFHWPANWLTACLLVFGAFRIASMTLATWIEDGGYSMSHVECVLFIALLIAINTELSAVLSLNVRSTIFQRHTIFAEYFNYVVQLMFVFLVGSAFIGACPPHVNWQRCNDATTNGTTLECCRWLKELSLIRWQLFNWP